MGSRWAARTRAVRSRMDELPQRPRVVSLSAAAIIGFSVFARRRVLSLRDRPGRAARVSAARRPSRPLWTPTRRLVPPRRVDLLELKTSKVAVIEHACF